MKHAGLRVAVTTSHSAPYQCDAPEDAVAFVKAWAADANIDILSSQLYSSGSETSPEFANSRKAAGCTWDLCKGAHVRARLALGGNTCWADMMQVGKVWCLTVNVTRRGESTFMRSAYVKLVREVSDPRFVFQVWHRAPRHAMLPPKKKKRHRHTVQRFSLTLDQEALLSFAPDSATGPSGLRPQHIKGSLLPGYRDELVRSLHAVVRIMVDGNIPGTIVPCMSRASLTASRKKDGSHWLVPCRRDSSTTAKALLPTFSEDMTRHLRPTQLGFGTENGSEAIVPRHQTMAPKNTWFLLTMNLENAFNQIDRSPFLRDAGPDQAL